MSWLRNLGGVVALGVLLTSLGCGGSSSTPTTPAPTYTSYTDVFSDGLIQPSQDLTNPDFGPGGSHHFTVHQGTNAFPASIVITLAFISPSTTIGVGMGVTSWNATTNTCNLPLLFTNPTPVTIGTAVPLTTGQTGDYCVGLFDNGSVLAAGLGPQSYTISITHN